ncbi:FG-GAP-like repeat-containing protein [Nannocystis radixulma]|uniref:FG-GAP-like repeat-containing protein n=1 Tax=Nannocystis radixulma TaxID=2995305 RepID=A0ABT5B7J7_9BACT|nr:FG-GAP-like repeat-containing protein [Nannocystis radixulma]MDC0670089.1 FG-GAP-like repeat-containing protein [Nannocystis radixulma]
MARATRTCASIFSSSVLLATACGDNSSANTDSGVSGTQGTLPITTDQTEPTAGSDGTVTATATEGTGTATDSATGVPTGPGSDTATTDPDTAGTVTDTGNTTSGTCSEDQLCSGVCCGAGELCDNGQCVPDCGGPPPCGEAKECCAADQLCYLGACVTPGAACSDQVCATKPTTDTCDDGFICDPNLGLCLPSQADPTCQYIPPANVFKPTPLFTWGKRKVIACNADADCQVAEVCTNQVCTPTWNHLIPQADDMPNHYQSSSIPIVVDLNDDCVPEIIFNTYTGTNITADGVLRAIRGDDGAKVWTVTDPMYRTNSTSNIAAGDIDMDGRAEIVASGAGKYLIAIDSDGTPLWRSENFAGTNSSGSVAIANMDNDGAPEILFGRAIFSNEGKLLYEGPGNQGQGLNNQGPISCVADLDGDMRPELIGGRTAYKTTGTVAGNDFAGSVLWTSNVASDGFCGVGDFDADGKPEVVLVTMGTVRVLNGQTGVQIATANIPQAGTGGPPNIADFDGDGVRDIGVAGSARYTVFQFNGMALSQLWTAATEDDSSQVTGSSVFDFDGDGRAEVVYNDEAYIRIYPGVEPDCAMDPPGPGCNKNMTDAEVLFRDRNSSRTRTEYPVIADVNGDFKADIVFSTNNDSQAALVTDAGIEVFKDSLDNWVSTRPVWNQHSYHITNVGLVGEIPVVEDPNWASFNSYRNNVQGAADFCAPDLVPYDLTFEAEACATGLKLSVWVANQGCLGVGPGVNVAFYEQNIGLLGVVPTKGPLVAGAAEQVTLEYAGAFDSVTVWAAADDDGTGNGVLNECVEDNNSSPMDQVCIPPG